MFMVKPVICVKKALSISKKKTTMDVQNVFASVKPHGAKAPIFTGLKYVLYLPNLSTS